MAAWLGISLVMALVWGAVEQPRTVQAMLPVFLLLAIGCVLQVYVHELGHLAGALMARLRVIEFAVFARRRAHGFRLGRVTVRLGLLGNVSHVKATGALDQRRRWRWAVLMVAGPLANLVAAAVAFLAGAGSTGLLVVVVPGLFIGIGNLLPVRYPTGQRTDGHRLLAYLRHTDRDLMARIVAGPDRVHGRAELPGLRALVDAGGPPAVAVARSLLATSFRFDQLADDTARLVALARDPATDAATASLLASWIAELRAVQVIIDASGSGAASIDPALVRPIEEIAELGYARAPERIEARVSLALCWVLLDRPTEARPLLAKADLSGVAARVRVNALAVWALAEAELGDLAEARRLADAAAAVDGEVTALRQLANAAVAEYERRSSLPAPA